MLMRKTRKHLKRFVKDREGVAAIEFAMIAPVLTFLVLASVDLGKMLIDRTDMQSAVRTGAQYLMNGGQDLDLARDLVLASWASRPEAGTVISERFCTCAEVVHACTSLCSDASIPESYVRLKAVGTLDGFLTDASERTEEIVRIR